MNSQSAERKRRREGMEEPEGTAAQDQQPNYIGQAGEAVDVSRQPSLPAGGAGSRGPGFSGAAQQVMYEGGGELQALIAAAAAASELSNARRGAQAQGLQCLARAAARSGAERADALPKGYASV